MSLPSNRNVLNYSLNILHTGLSSSDSEFERNRWDPARERPEVCGQWSRPIPTTLWWPAAWPCAFFVVQLLFVVRARFRTCRLRGLGRVRRLQEAPSPRFRGSIRPEIRRSQRKNILGHVTHQTSTDSSPCIEWQSAPTGSLVVDLYTGPCRLGCNRARRSTSRSRGNLSSGRTARSCAAALQRPSLPWPCRRLALELRERVVAARPAAEIATLGTVAFVVVVNVGVFVGRVRV